MTEVAMMEREALLHMEIAEAEQLTTMDMLERKWDEGKFLCVGLDLVADADGSLFEKAKMIVDATKDIAAAFKPNSAFYERGGSATFEEMEQLVAYIKELAPDVPVIWDAKRADIASTNQGYANARDHLGADAITIHPYLGGKDLAPLLKDPRKLGIVLAHTSNPGADELQHLRLQNGMLVWEQVAQNIAHDPRWQHGSALGVVMGATYPDEIGKARHIVGDDVMMLIPGIGKQGGDLEKSVRGAMNTRGNGFLINVSSAISTATNKHGVTTPTVIRREAMRYHKEINAVWSDALDNPQPTYAERMFLDFDMRLGETLLRANAIKFGEFTLKSGMKSPIYADLRNLITDPQARRNITQLYVDMVVRQEEARGRQFDLIAGNPQAATAFGTLVADRLDRRLVQPRAGSAKDHGTGRLVEGDYHEGEEVVLIEDLTTTAASVMEGAAKLKASGLVLRGVVSILDREQGGTERLRFFNIPYTAASTLRRAVGALGTAGLINEDDHRRTMDYLNAA